MLTLKHRFTFITFIYIGLVDIHTRIKVSTFIHRYQYHNIISNKHIIIMPLKLNKIVRIQYQTYLNRENNEWDSSLLSEHSAQKGLVSYSDRNDQLQLRPVWPGLLYPNIWVCHALLCLGLVTALK